MRPEGIDWRTPHPLSISQNFLIGEDVATYPDAFVADEKRRRSCDQRLYLVLRLAAERARDRVLEHRVVRSGGGKRGPGGVTRLSRFDLGGKDIPIVIAECLRDQLQTFAMGGFDGLRFQCIAQGVRHGLRIAKIAHESTSSSANGRNRGLPCRPVRQWRGPWKEIDTFTIPEGRRRRVYQPCWKFGARPGVLSIETML